MKLAFRKNQIIVTTLAVMVAVAGYLNYSGKILEEKENISVSMDDQTVLFTDDTQEVTNYEDTYTDVVSLEDDGSEAASIDEEIEDSDIGIGDAVLASSMDITDNVLAEVKLNREQIRSRSKEELQNLIDDENVPEDEKKNAAEVMAILSQQAQLEADAELLLEAKGFTGAVVSITDQSADVVVNAEELTEAQRAQIEDIVKRKTEISGENIVINCK